MALHGLLMLLMSSICLQPKTNLISSEAWKMSPATQTALSAPSTLLLRWMEAMLRMLPCHKPSLTCATSLTQRWKTSDGPDELIATCQRHTRCSPAYCLKKKKGVQECRFGYPKPLQPVTTIDMEGSTPTLLTQRNDCLLNSYNPVQLSAWRANVDMQYIVSRNSVLNYIAKYAAKSEPRSKGLKAVYGNVLRTLKSDGSSLKMVQKMMISSVG